MVKCWDPKAVATPATAPPDSSPQRACSLPADTPFRSSNHQTINFAARPEQGWQAHNTHSYSRILIQGHYSRSDVGFACLTNPVGQAWVRILGSLLRTIPEEGRGHRQSQEGVGRQGGRKGNRRRRTRTTTEVEEGHEYYLNDNLTESLPEVYGPQVLPSTRDRNFGGEYEELEHLEARSIVITFLIPLFLQSPRVPLVIVGFEITVRLPLFSYPYPLTVTDLFLIITPHFCPSYPDFLRCCCSTRVPCLLILAPRLRLCILTNTNPPSLFPLSPPLRSPAPLPTTLPIHLR